MRRPSHVAILAGGKGTRFWPLGRESRPKQVLALDGDDPRPLLRATWDRVAPLCDRHGPWVIASQALGRTVRGLLPKSARRRLVLEPRGRNTAAAVAVAAHAVASEDPEATLVVVPADHHVAPLSAYRAALRAMLDRAAGTDAILTLGLRPDHPATGYGYLHVGPRRATSPAGPVHAVVRFVEKPDLARATRFARDGRHLWNGGTFAFRPWVFLAELERSAKDVARAMAPLFDAGPAWRRRLAQVYARVPSVSVDYAVMERAPNVETVAARLSWDDLGSFDAVLRTARRDARGSVLPRGTVAIDSRDSLVRVEDGTTVALLGVEDLIVVRTKDATLVARRGRGEDMRRVVEELRRLGREDLLR
jgi:mannose-1-phosphate guanylyltransferase/mannose-6-phosphate isomerase